MGADRSPNLILVGLPGSGKTTVGRALATRLGREFIDFDEMIVEREGMSVADIFGSKGEPYFRNLERGLTAPSSPAAAGRNELARAIPQR